MKTKDKIQHTIKKLGGQNVKADIKGNLVGLHGTFHHYYSPVILNLKTMTVSVRNRATGRFSRMKIKIRKIGKKIETGLENIR